MCGKIVQTIDQYNDKLHFVRFGSTKENEINSKANKEPPDVFQRQEVCFRVRFYLAGKIKG